MRKKISAKDRNEEIYQLLIGYLNNSQSQPEFCKPFDVTEVETLFSTTIRGHREIVLTILMTRLVYPGFKATKDLYRYNPRSVYEGPIRHALRENRIPHTKSAPLNVAKNIKRLNKDWAAGKKQEDVAVCVVKVVEKIESVSKAELSQFATAYISRYKQEAKKISNLEVELSPKENPIYLSKLCIDLINEVPDGGASPQHITGLLMEVGSLARGSDVLVSGHADSVSTTNTTSGKPGDIIEHLRVNNKELVYEITTKVFTDNRLRDSYEAIKNYGRDISDVFVICRPEDVLESLDSSPSTFLMASTQYNGVSYYFINIYQYVRSSLLFMPAESRRSFHERLTKYINETNRSEKVKLYFQQWHERNP